MTQGNMTESSVNTAAEPAIWLPGIEWVKIEAGQFVYQAGKKTSRDVSVATFWMARYPITNAQYACFVQAGGYTQDEYWAGLKKPEFTPSRWPQANRPKTDVNWYEAKAYCAWLTAQLALPAGYVVTLPDEQQWEYAAVGYGSGKTPSKSEADVFAWGEVDASDIAERANVNDQLGQTSPVGLYPRGLTPHTRLADLTGNVWEWCVNSYNDNKNACALRGGAWRFHPDFARARFRFDSHPDSRSSLIGFRVVLARPYTGH